MPVDDIIKLLIVFSLVVLPALGLTARFALKPIVDAILRLREGGMLPGDSANALGAGLHQLRGQLQGVQDEIAQMRVEVGRMREAESFHLALGDGAAPATLPRPGSASQS